jgi:hypothetical protein
MRYFLPNETLANWFVYGHRLTGFIFPAMAERLAGSSQSHVPVSGVKGIKQVMSTNSLSGIDAKGLRAKHDDDRLLIFSWGKHKGKKAWFTYSSGQVSVKDLDLEFFEKCLELPLLWERGFRVMKANTMMNLVCRNYKSNYKSNNKSKFSNYKSTNGISCFKTTYRSNWVTLPSSKGC